MDQNVNLYRICIRSKKWWLGLFAFCVDVAICSAWYLHERGPTENRSQQSLLDFRLEITNTYLMKYRRCRAAIGRPLGTFGRHRPLYVHSSPQIRFDSNNHHIESIATQRRCAVWGMKIMKIYSKCQVSLYNSASLTLSYRLSRQLEQQTSVVVQVTLDVVILCMVVLFRGLMQLYIKLHWELCKLENNYCSLKCKKDRSSDHTGKYPSEDRNRNCRRTGGIPTKNGGKRPNHESQNTDAQGMRAPVTTLRD